MKRYLFAATLMLLPLGALSATTASAEVNLSIGVNLPAPGVVVAAPSPDVYVIADSNVYYAPEAEEDVFFYHGYWYKPVRDRWYRSPEYGRNWVMISIGRVPQPVRVIPPDFRSAPPRHERIPYGQLKKNWRSWERERHWERDHEARDRHDDHGDRWDRGNHGDRGDRGHGHRKWKDQRED